MNPRSSHSSKRTVLLSLTRRCTCHVTVIVVPDQWWHPRIRCLARKISKILDIIGSMFIFSFCSQTRQLHILNHDTVVFIPFEHICCSSADVYQAVIYSLQQFDWSVRRRWLLWQLVDFFWSPRCTPTKLFSASQPVVRCREISFVLKNKFIADSTFALSFWTMSCQWYQRITNILNHHSLNFSVVQINLVNKLFTDINTQSTRTWTQETPITKLFLFCVCTAAFASFCASVNPTNHLFYSFHKFKARWEYS